MSADATTLQGPESPVVDRALKEGGRSGTLWSRVRRRSVRVTFFITLAIAALYLADLRPGHDWTPGDFSMYILHAKNIVEGEPYMATGYVYNPRTANIGPRAYPPGYPLFLAPVYALFGLDLLAMKVQLVLFFAGALFCLGLLTREELPAPHWLAFLPLVAFFPFLWRWKDVVIPDFPMLFFMVLALLAFARAQSPGRSGRARTLGALLAGGAAFFAILVRPAAVTLLPTFVAYDLIRTRRLSRQSLIAVGVAVAPYLGVRLLLPMGSGYTGTIAGYVSVALHDLQFLRSVPRNVEASVIRLGGLWSNGYLRPVQFLVFGATGLLAAVGFFHRLFRRFTVIEPFVVFNLAVALIWGATSVQFRYFMPVIPFYFLYILAGITVLQGWLGDRRHRVLAAMLVLMFGSYAGRFVYDLGGEAKSGVTDSNATEMFRYIRQNTEEDAVFIFRIPRVLTLYTNRRTAVYHKGATDRQMLEQFREFDVRYVLVGPGDYSWQLMDVVDRNPDLFVPLHANPELQLYRFVDPGVGGSGASGGSEMNRGAAGAERSGSVEASGVVDL